MKVLSSELYDKGFERLIEELLAGLKAPKKNLLVSPSDANVLVHARTNLKFKEILDYYAYNLPDGVPSVWVGKLKGAKKMDRCSGPDLTETLIRKTNGLGIRHYFLGGSPDVLESMILNLLKKDARTIVSGSYSPPYKEFSELEIMGMAEKVKSSGADIVWIGLGAPKQILFSHTFSKYSDTFYIIPVGAAFDFLAGNVSKAPRWIQQIGMEWFYRLIQEPQRLGKRYFKVVPLFIYYNILDWLKGD